MAVLVIAAVAAVGSNNEDMVAPAIIAGIIVIIWVYSNARLQYLLLYGYGELIDKVSDLEARSQGGKREDGSPSSPQSPIRSRNRNRIAAARASLKPNGGRTAAGNACSATT